METEPGDNKFAVSLSYRAKKCLKKQMNSNRNPKAESQH